MTAEAKNVIWAWFGRISCTVALGLSATAVTWANSIGERVTRNEERIAAAVKAQEERDAERKREADRQTAAAEAFRKEYREDQAEIKRALEALRRP